MKRVLTIAAILLVAACSSSRVQLNAGTHLSAPDAGGLHVHSSGSAATVLLVIGVLAATAGPGELERPFPDPRALIPGNSEPRAAPPLDPSRRVNEQDCSKPVDLSAGNLRCR